MKKTIQIITIKLFLSISLFTIISCGSSSNDLSDHNYQYNNEHITNTLPSQNQDQENTSQEDENFKYLALGDSYTIGTSVCEECNYPRQLKNELETELNITISTNIIAQSGWTTTSLKSAIKRNNPPNDFDLVTLLIGVNNQFQNRNFDVYEKEFPDLLNQAIKFAKGNPDNVIVISIPDYAYTPFGQNSSDPNKISSEIDRYNYFARQTTIQKKVEFVNITDITRKGLNDINLVASDNLHPSEKAYSKFVDRLFLICSDIFSR